MIKLNKVLCAVATIVAVPAFAQVMPAAKYVQIAGASDMFEIQSAKAMLESTQDPKIHAFAQMMVQDHGKSSVQIKAAAARSHVMAPPPMLMPLQVELLAELQAEIGAARDATYIAQQRAAHNQALSVQKAYAQDGTAPALRMTAASIVPMVEHHIEVLKSM